MRLFAKVFAGVMAILCLSLAAAGYLMISMSFQLSYQNKKEQAVSQYQITEYLLESRIGQSSIRIMQEEGFLADMAQVAAQVLQSDGMIAVVSDGTELYNSFPQGFSLPTVQENAVISALEQYGSSYVLTVCGALQETAEPVHLITGYYITDIINQKQQMTADYSRIYLYVCLFGGVLSLALSVLLVRPINRLSKSAAEIAGGNYGARTDVRTKDEVGELGENFNRMACAVEASMEELRNEAVRKEDFVGNFAHELKTPLTSVIGYADMICSRSLPMKEIRRAAQYILDEGMRLEELSLKLMDLTVLNRQDFLLEELSARDVLMHVAGLVEPVLNKRRVKLHLTVEDADIRVEFDLFETLLMNLLDNASKADAENIYMDGRRLAGGYRIMVNDDGRGIPEDELNRITEAFYMVDKSRSRRQHGAGLGLALAAKIAQIHGARLQFASRVGVGTKAAVTLPAGKAEERGQRL